MDKHPKKSFIKRFWWPIIIALLIVSFGSLIFVIFRNNCRTNNSLNANVSLKNSNDLTSTENEIIDRKRSQIESAYPEYKDFKNQESFAGQDVEIMVDGYDHYFTYLVLGSGLPIAQATCFRVDHMMRVYKIGEFPDMLDSYAGYRDIDPKTCLGIK